MGSEGTAEASPGTATSRKSVSLPNARSAAPPDLAPTQGAPVQGAPVQVAPVQVAPVQVAPADGQEHGREHDGRSRQRSETMRVLARMAALPADDPERAGLRAEVIEDHMPYARHIAQRYGGHGTSTEDFEQVAYLGLVKAVDNFDPGHGTGFLGYATPMIIGEIKRYFRDATWGVHVPRRMQELTGALRKATDTLTHDLGREPTIAELAERLGAEPEEVVEAIDAAGAYTTASLDHPVNTEDQAASLLEFMGEEDARFEAVIDRQVLTALLAELGERDKRILLMRYFRGMTQAEIGVELGVSQMQISRLLSRILRELREGFG